MKEQIEAEESKKLVCVPQISANSKKLVQKSAYAKIGVVDRLYTDADEKKEPNQMRKHPSQSGQDSAQIQPTFGSESIGSKPSVSQKGEGDDKPTF